MSVVEKIIGEVGTDTEGAAAVIAVERAGGKNDDAVFGVGIVAHEGEGTVGGAEVVIEFFLSVEIGLIPQGHTL